MVKPFVLAAAYNNTFSSQRTGWALHVEKWSRNVVSHAVLYTATAAYVVASPVLLVAALVAGLATGLGLAFAQAWAIIGFYLVFECVGTVIATLVSLFALATGAMPYSARFRSLHNTMATAWCGTAFRVTHWLMRNSVDVMLSVALFGASHAVRIVMKRELLYDPFIEAAGTRCDNYYINRDNRVNMDVELQGVARLMSGPVAPEYDGRHRAVAIYPEGTRLTESKRQAVLRSLEKSGNTAMLEYARSLKATLPPRLKGLMSLVRECPKADVLFIGHVGYDEALSMLSMIKGKIFNTPLSARVFRLAGDELEGLSEDAREKAVLRVWKELDEWVWQTKNLIKTDSKTYFARLHEEYRANPAKFTTIGVRQ